MTISSHLRPALCSANEGANLSRLDAFLTFLAQRLPAADYCEAEELLCAAFSPTLAARREREQTAT
jgi:hypothetical protein